MGMDGRPAGYSRHFAIFYDLGARSLPSSIKEALTYVFVFFTAQYTFSPLLSEGGVHFTTASLGALDS